MSVEKQHIINIPKTETAAVVSTQYQSQEQYELSSLYADVSQSTQAWNIFILSMCYLLITYNTFKAVLGSQDMSRG